MNRFFIFSILVLVSLPVSGEESTAFLVRGPVKETGLSYIYPNAFEIYKGFYRYGKQDIIVIFTPGDFIIPENWTGKTCGDYTGYVFADSSGEPGGVIFCYREKPENKKSGWWIFIRFPENYDCTFISVYLRRLEYFQRDWNPPSPPLLPAVVEFK